MDELSANLSKVRVPDDNQVIYKDECVYSFDTPESSTGLYVNLYSFLGFGEAYAKRYALMTGNLVFLHILREKVFKDNTGENTSIQTRATDATKEESGPDCKITRLAIGLEGGFSENKNYEYKNSYNIIVFSKNEVRLPYPNFDFPLVVTSAVESLLLSESAIEKLEKESVVGTWDGEVRQVSMYSENLMQLDNGKKIPPSGWKCEKCDLLNNLWLNLTDGSILCGRKFFDGSGGNDHAVQHYKECGYPLAVKLGTITADGKSDVFSYPEDDMVIDTNLEEHLAHFGVNMAAMKKSEKSMVELELEINQRVGEWSLLTECNSELQPLTGPGYTGMRNLGNSCYINSVVQVLFTVPDFIERYVGNGAEKYFAAFPPDPANDFDIQMAKLGNGLWSGKYSRLAKNSLSQQNGIAPNMFKNVVGKNHPDFSTKQQQDAYDFYLHMLNILESHSHAQCNPVAGFNFRVEERFECMSSKKVKYSYRDELSLPLMIPIERAINLEEVCEYLAKADSNKIDDKDIVRYIVPFEVCLEKFFAPEIIEQFYSSAVNCLTTAKKSTRFASMPEYLMMHLRKFTLGDDWVPKKLDVSIDMPSEVDLSHWRATGVQPGEELLLDRDLTAKNVIPQFEFDQTVMRELLLMGFPQEACKRAVFHTKNSGLQTASEWLMEHIADSNIADPFVIPSYVIGDGMASVEQPNPEKLATLVSMGFDIRHATKALKATHGNLERATDWIISHMGDVDMDDISTTTEMTSTSGITQGKSYRDGIGKYKLVAFISHMGTSAQVGHYVCHILKNGQWVIFNDEKVSLSQKPPKDLGYLYLYRREE